MLSGHADGRKATPKPIRRRRDHLTSLAGIIAEMGRIYRRMRAGKLDATEAQKRVWVLERMRAGVSVNLLRATISVYRVGCPKQRTGVGIGGLARVDEPWTVDQPQHGLT